MQQNYPSGPHRCLHFLVTFYPSQCRTDRDGQRIRHQLSVTDNNTCQTLVLFRSFLLAFYLVVIRSAFPNASVSVKKKNLITQIWPKKYCVPPLARSCCLGVCNCVKTFHSPPRAAPLKQLRATPTARPHPSTPQPRGPGHHHFPATIHLRPAINSLHFQAQAINPGTLN